MMKRTAWMVLAVVLCTGLTCQIRLGDGGNGTSDYVKLSDATAGITITATTADSSAQVAATITRNGQPVRLQAGQAVSVNDVDLLGPDSSNQYTATVPRLSEYKIVVTEPTQGVQETRITGPADFSITAPATGATISLSDGFAMAWTNADANLNATVTLSQHETGQVSVVGPVADTGALQITHQNLAAFGQWPSLPIKLTKTAKATSVKEFAGANVTIELSQSISVVPAS